MGRTQLNINIDPDLMQKLKEGSIKSGKTITEFVSDAITDQLENTISEDLETRMSAVEKRLSSLEGS